MDRLDVERADIATADAVAPLERTRAVRLLGWLSELADQPQLLSLCAAATVAGLATRNPRLARTGARMLAAELLATQLKSVVKHRVDRTRPYVLAKGGRYRMAPGDARSSALTSFPSGHTAGAVAVARALVRDYPARAPLGYATAAAVAAIQVPRGKHYLTDLAAGALIGLIAGAGVRQGERAGRAVIGRIVRPAARPPVPR